MNDTERTARLARVKQAIETRSFVRNTEATPIASKKADRKVGGHWLFDIRAIELSAPILDDLTHLFWESRATKTPVQLGGMETAGIPFVAAFVAGAHAFGVKDMSGFFIRKSRKKDGLMRMIEGEMRPGVPIILLDDLINSGHTSRKQVEILESLGQKVTEIWTLVRFRDLDYYTYFAEKGITVTSLFELNDFPALGTKNISQRDSPPIPSNYSIRWKFIAGRASYQYVVPKSNPVIDDTRLYVGSDTGIFWALEQDTGKVAWQYQIGHHPKGKGIFSSPVVHEGVVYFGGYDGNVYALEAATGKKRWVSMEADWIGSSPAIAPDLGLLFIGLEFGLWRRRGGIAAIDLKTGKTQWHFSEMPCFTHSTPLYIHEHQQVIIGSNDGCAYLFDAKTGALLWKTPTGEITLHELNSGFSAHDIKESIAYDAKRDLVIVANMNGSLYFIDRATGEVRSSFQAEFGLYCTPLIVGDRVYVSSLDKNLYCIDLDTFNEKWRWSTGARIFASPTLIGKSIFIGANTGRLTELDPETKAERSFYQFTERITNRPVYNPRTKRFFVPTFANEIYCIERPDVA